MASRSSSIHLVAGAVVVVAVHAARSPGYCMPGQAFPRSPLRPCRWYVAVRNPCSAIAVPRLAVWYMEDMCCRQLGLVPPECRCKALRVMMEEARLQSPPAAADETCWAELGDFFAASLVMEAECGLSTVHGRPYCDALAADDRSIARSRLQLPRESSYLVNRDPISKRANVAWHGDAR